MERKRKLPARAAARVEQVAKKRNITPRERSETPAAAQPPEDPPPPPLPKSIQAGKPLPTVEVAQSEDLSAKEYQSVGESGVLAESLSRSRNKWISDGLFEKFWTKPHKRKGVVNEDPKNPPKDSMSKVGTVTITIEPHVIEATMFVVKDPKPRLQPQQLQPQQLRPILQYGPPNGSMPPPPTPPQTTSATSTPTPAAAQKTVSHSPAPAPVALAQHSPRPLQEHPTPQASGSQVVPPPMAPNMTPSPSPSYQPRPNIAGVPVPPSATSPQMSRAPSNPPQHGILGAPSMMTGQGLVPAGPLAAPMATAAPQQPTSTHSTPTPGLVKPATPSVAASTPVPAAPAKPSPNDPVIALLAQRASGDSALRDLMKRVAVGQAKEGELAHFQKIIDNLNQEYRSKGGQQGPSADRLIVDGRTVKYFALEVRAIIDVVLASNPNQKSTDLRPPPRSDPLVVLLVKTAIEDQRTKDIIKRIADGRPGFTDATDLKEILDRLHRDMKTVPQGSPAPSLARPQQASNGVPNGQARAPIPQTIAPPNPQALRSKGPPPAPKPEISAVVFDFGNGDRYLFPKFSILEYMPAPSGQQVVASFLIVQKGSVSEYGGDPKLDYYEPVTIRLYTHTGRHLENLQRVVAPQDEVRRYMDDVMDNMTRAEYVLLAMRLPRVSKEGEKENGALDEPQPNGSTPKPDTVHEQSVAPKPGVLWGPQAKPATPPIEGRLSRPLQDAEQETQARYQKLINSITAKDPDAL
ncbi:Fc.00g022750.m01.CDS01 [Cosmosporella sp. VM-42]